MWCNCNPYDMRCMYKVDTNDIALFDTQLFHNEIQSSHYSVSSKAIRAPYYIISRARVALHSGNRKGSVMHVTLIDG